MEPEVTRRLLTTALARIKDRNWHLQIYTRLSIIALVQDLIRTAPVPVVFDHFGGAQGPLGPAQQDFDVLLNLVRAGKAYVKISAPYRSSSQAPGFSDVAPLAKALVAANPQRIIWGSDWPHPWTLEGQKVEDVAPNLETDDGATFNLLATWVPDAAVRKTILVDNPARLYQF
jgi:predicted TIM-barrel fold metal-dependent hydrolase